MALKCSYIPRNKEGEILKGFQAYKRALGYQTATKVFTQVLSPSFKEDYKKTLEIDEQGVPTYESAIKVSYVKNLVGTTKLIETDQKSFPYVDNTRENYQRLVLSAHSYNTSSDNKDNLVAVVRPSGDSNQIRVEIVERNEATQDESNNQYSTSLLNTKLEGLLGDLGVSIDLLERNEITNGYVDFSKASSIADGFAGLINIANGMEGELALSEEFSHLLIDMFRNEPLVQRSLRMLSSNEDLLHEILGDEYQRNADYYAENPNYDENGEEISLNETLAEESLGKVLQEKMKTSTIATSEEESKPLQNLITRFINFIKRVFKGKSSDDILKAKNEVSATMGELAKDVLTGTKKLSQDELIKNRRNARFNQLKDTTDKILQLLQNADEIERKRSKITTKDNIDKVKERIIKLEALMTDKNKLEGVHTYAKWALKDLQEAMDKLDVSGTLQSEDFTSLRHIKSVIDSYGGFVKDFHEALDSLENDVVVIKGEEINLRELWRDINDIYESCDMTFKKQAYAAFSDFLAPIYEKSPLRNEDGSIIPIKDVLVSQELDISEFDRWLTSMGTSSSLLLQLFDKAVKNAKDKVRLSTMDNTRDIWKLREKAENYGITSFEWMFEKDAEGHKTGNYISEYNQGQFEKDKKAMEQSLIDKYGKHPIGEDFKKALTERREWYKSHASMTVFNTTLPNETYKNKDYAKLSKAQKEVLNDFLEYKRMLELELPQDRRDTNRAIQRRRISSQRLSDTLSNPKQAYESIKEDLKSAFKSAEDDDILYGERTQGLTDFTGQEYMTLPILYTGRLSNPDVLSTDVFGDLMAYSYMVNNYKEVSKIYDPLEIGVTVAAQKELVKGADSKAKEEVLNVLGRVTRKNIKIGSNTSFAKKLRDYLECQVYGRYLKEDDIVGKDAQKTLSVFQRLTSTAYLGCNYLAGVANIATAVGMQNIEAAAREHFSAKELLAADGEYGKLLPEFLTELPNRVKQSKLALFDELFDVKQDVKDRMHNVQMKSIFRRFFGTNWLFIQQGAGDHWIYNRTAIAMAKHTKVKVDGKTMPLWDALEIVTDKNGYKMMKVKDDAILLDEKGNEVGNFDIGAFSRKVAHVNHTLVGIYNDDDQNAANQVIIGRLAQQMRKWIIPQMMRRFQSKRMIVDLGKEEEGYYRTFGRLAKDLWKSGFKVASEWDKLSDTDKANVRRAFTEILQTYGLWILITCLGSGIKDPDRSWAAKFAEYMLHRETHELGFLTPGPMMLTEGYKTITSPLVSLSAANSIAQAMLTTMWPGNWFPDDDELIKSGRYEGHSHIYKRWAELPLPPMTQFRQIEKFIDDLDTGTKYYSRDYK